MAFAMAQTQMLSDVNPLDDTMEISSDAGRQHDEDDDIDVDIDLPSDRPADDAKDAPMTDHNLENQDDPMFDQDALIEDHTFENMDQDFLADNDEELEDVDNAETSFDSTLVQADLTFETNQQLEQPAHLTSNDPLVETALTIDDNALPSQTQQWNATEASATHEPGADALDNPDPVQEAVPLAEADAENLTALSSAPEQTTSEEIFQDKQHPPQLDPEITGPLEDSNSVPYIHPVVVSWKGDQFSLFHGQDDGSYHGYFLNDTSSALSDLSSLIVSLRDILGDDCPENAELCLTFPALALTLTQTSSTSHSSLNLVEVVELYYALCQNDGIEYPGPLEAILSTRQDPEVRLSELRQALEAGKGLSQIVREDLLLPERVTQGMVREHTNPLESTEETQDQTVQDSTNVQPVTNTDNQVEPLEDLEQAAKDDPNTLHEDNSLHDDHHNTHEESELSKSKQIEEKEDAEDQTDDPGLTSEQRVNDDEEEEEEAAEQEELEELEDPEEEEEPEELEEPDEEEEEDSSTTQDQYLDQEEQEFAQEAEEQPNDSIQEEHNQTGTEEQEVDVEHQNNFEESWQEDEYQSFQEAEEDLITGPNNNYLVNNPDALEEALDKEQDQAFEDDAALPEYQAEEYFDPNQETDLHGLSSPIRDPTIDQGNEIFEGEEEESYVEAESVVNGHEVDDDSAFHNFDDFIIDENDGDQNPGIQDVEQDQLEDLEAITDTYEQDHVEDATASEQTYPTSVADSSSISRKRSRIDTDSAQTETEADGNDAKKRRSG